MLIKTLLNKVEHFKSFIFGNACVTAVNGFESVIVDIKPRKNGKPECPECGRRGKVHNTLPERLFEYVPFLKFKFFFRYSPRRVKCPTHGVKVEAMPWAYGKERSTISYQVFLAGGRGGSPVQPEGHVWTPEFRYSHGRLRTCLLYR